MMEYQGWNEGKCTNVSPSLGKALGRNSAVLRNLSPVEVWKNTVKDGCSHSAFGAVNRGIPTTRKRRLQQVWLDVSVCRGGGWPAGVNQTVRKQTRAIEYNWVHKGEKEAVLLLGL